MVLNFHDSNFFCTFEVSSLVVQKFCGTKFGDHSEIKSQKYLKLYSNVQRKLLTVEAICQNFTPRKFINACNRQNFTRQLNPKG